MIRIHRFIYFLLWITSSDELTFKNRKCVKCTNAHVIRILFVNIGFQIWFSDFYLLWIYSNSNQHTEKTIRIVGILNDCCGVFFRFLYNFLKPNKCNFFSKSKIVWYRNSIATKIWMKNPTTIFSVYLWISVYKS